MIKGGVLALLVYFFLVAWVAKTAERRGRIGLAWAGLAAVVGAIAIIGGIVLVSHLVDVDSSTGALLLAVFSPLVGMIAAISGLAGILVALPIATATRRFSIHDMAAHAEAGSLEIADTSMRIDLPSGSMTVLLVALRDVQADGECIRLKWTDGDATVSRTFLMGGTPNTPEGRKQQSKVLARQLRAQPAPRAQLRR